METVKQSNQIKLAEMCRNNSQFLHSRIRSGMTLGSNCGRMSQSYGILPLFEECRNNLVPETKVAA